MSTFTRNENGDVIAVAENDPRATGDAIGASLQQQGIYQSPEGWAIVTGSPGGKLGGAPRIILDTDGKRPPKDVLDRFPMASPQEQQGFQQQAAKYRAGEGKSMSLGQAVLAGVGAYFGMQGLGSLVGGLGASAGAGGAFDMGGTAGALGDGASGASDWSQILTGPGSTGASDLPAWAQPTAGGVPDTGFWANTIPTNTSATGAFDMGGSQGVFDGAGNPLMNPNAGSGFYQTLTSLGVPSGVAGSVLSALSSGSDLKTALQLAGVGATIAGAVLNSTAAKDASKVQAQSADSAIAEQRRQFDLNRSDNAPFLATGTNANARLGQLLGTNKADGSVPADATAEGGYGSLLRRFGVNDLNKDPVYNAGLQFGADQGAAGINARATQAGNYDSGATLKALTRFGNDYGTTKAEGAYNRYTNDQSNTYARLTGQSGAGQTAVGQNMTSGANTTNAITDLTTGAGNARAAGIIGGANAWGQAATGLNTAANNYGNSEILKQILPQRSASYWTNI